MTEFPFFATPWPLWLILCFGLGVSWLTLRGYFRRSAEVKPARLRVLKIVRLLGWGMLIVCLLQPVQREFTRENKSNRLTVLVDDSESFSFVDQQNGLSRLQRVKELLAGKNSAASAFLKPDENALFALLSRSFQIQLESFSTGTHSVARGSHEELLRGLNTLTGQGESTDLTRALNESLTRLKGSDAGGLVLISDGADTFRGELDRAAQAFKRAGIPIYVLGVGDPAIHDLSIAQIRCRRTVSKDTLVRVEVDVRRTSLPEGKHLVTLSRLGKQVGEPVLLDLKNETGTAVFEFLPDAQGFLEYEASVAPFAGELVLANNTLAFGLVAHSRKLRVLYMEGSMYVHRGYASQSLGMNRGHPMQSWWEHQFLERALTEDLDVEVDVLAKDEFTTQAGDAQIQIKTVKEGYPKTKKALYQYDVIINSDIPYSAFSPDQVQWTVDFVGKHGGGLVMIGGWHAFGEGGYSKTPFDRMLPVEMTSGDSHLEDIEFNWEISEEGWQHPIMELEKDAQKNREAWARLPAFHGFSRTTRLKPAAKTLAVVANEEEFGTGYGAAILLAVQPYGNGRSMAFTTDSTGGWGAEWEDTWGRVGEVDLADRNRYFKQFWKNTIRWLAHYRMQAPNQLVQIESDRLVYGRGEQPSLRVKVMNEDYELTQSANVQISIAGPDGAVQTLTVFPKYDEPGIYERKLELSLVGRYEISAKATTSQHEKDEIGSDRTILQVRPASAETRQLSQDVELLQKLALQTGGVYLPIERASELPAHLREATHIIEKHRDHDLWDRPWIFLIIIGLFCGEWYLRKRNGLP